MQCSFSCCLLPLFSLLLLFQTCKLHTSAHCHDFADRTFFLLISLFCPMLLLQELTSFLPLSFLLLLNYGAFLDSVLPLPFDSSSFNLFSTKILILPPCVSRTIYEEASPVSWFALPSICAFYFTKLSKVSVYSFMILYVHHFIPHIFIYST